MAGTQSILTGKLCLWYAAITPRLVSKLKQNWREAVKWLDSKAGRCQASSREIYYGRLTSSAVSPSAWNHSAQGCAENRPSVERQNGAFRASTGPWLPIAATRGE